MWSYSIKVKQNCLSQDSVIRTYIQLARWRHSLIHTHFTADVSSSRKRYLRVRRLMRKAWPLTQVKC